MSVQDEINTIFWIDIKDGSIIRPSVGRNGEFTVLAMMGSTREDTVAYTVEKSANGYRILCMRPGDDPRSLASSVEIERVSIREEDILFMHSTRDRLVIAFQEKMIHHKKPVKTEDSNLKIFTYERSRDERELTLIDARDLRSYFCPVSCSLDENGIFAIRVGNNVEWIDTNVPRISNLPSRDTDGRFALPFKDARVELMRDQGRICMGYWKFEKRSIHFVMTDGFNDFESKETWEVKFGDRSKFIFPKTRGRQMRYFICMQSEGVDVVHYVNYVNQSNEEKRETSVLAR
jgi:hypothetical protein